MAMELNTILELVKAGFTKDEIMQMAQPEHSDPNPAPVPAPVDNPAPAPEPAPAPAPAPVAPAVPVPQPAPQPQPVQAPAQDQPTMADLMEGIAKLTSAVQANAIRQSVIPGGLTNPPTAEDMIAEIIRPTYKERS